MRYSAWLLLAAWVFVGVAAADVVYLKDGKSVEGKVTKTDGKVIVDTGDGHKTEFAAEDVILVKEKPFAASSGPSAAAGSVTVQTGIENPTRPESITFMLMRKLATATPGPASLDLRRQTDQYIAMAHDKKRLVGTDWALPKDFIYRRTAYQQGLKDAADVFKRLKSLKKADSPKDFMSPAYLKLVQTASGWEDPLLRNFLQGVAHLSAGNAQMSYNCFHAARQDAPRVAAFAQGEALALMDLDRGTDALASAMEALKLKPDSPDALALARKAMEKVPGTEVKTPTYTAAKEMLAQYEDAGTSTATPKVISWLMPGKPLAGKDESLPEPPMDRLVFRQAVAVPVTDNMLLVDSAVVGDALDVLVRIDAKTLVTATVKKLSSSVKPGQLPSLSAIVVTDAKFTPLVTEGIDFKDKPATLSGVGVFDEMGSTIRTAAVKANAVGEGSFKVSGRLLAGESTSPVVTSENTLVGFLTGKTDVTADGGGPDGVIDAAAINALLKATKGGAAPGKPKRTITPVEAKGSAFLVFGVGSEKFEK